MNLFRKFPNKNFVLVILLLILNFISFIFYLTVKNSSNYRFTENFSLGNSLTKDDNSDLIRSNNTRKKIDLLSKELSNSSITQANNSIYNLCSIIPKNLVGRISIDKKSNTTIEEIEKSLEYLNLAEGGLSSPKECEARHKVAIIVPYRNRETNLKIFLRNMHPYLRKQEIDFGIYIVEPTQNLTFNRGLLMNIGFLESLKLTKNKWDCFVFHDVDLIPEDDRNIYSCPEEPRHMSGAVSTFNYRLPYEGIFGGVSSLTKEQMKKVNGYSNLYFGWGGEDDDFRARIVGNGYKISRYPLEIGRYLMVSHSRDQVVNPQRFNLLSEATRRMKTEGLNSIEYKIVEINLNKLYTKILVSYDQDALLNKKYK